MKTIAFVPRRSQIRLFKIAKALRLSGRFRLVCVCEEAWYSESLFEGLFDEVHFFKPKPILGKGKVAAKLSEKFRPAFRNLVKILNRIQPDLVSAFCEPYDHIAYILKHSSFPVMLTDGADFTGISEGIPNLSDRTRKQEKYVLEHIVAWCYKGPKHVSDYYRSFGYKIQADEFTWLDQCDADLFADKGIKKLSDTDGETHCVYTGNVSDDPALAYLYYLPLARLLAGQKVHFHVYARAGLFRSYKAYQQLDRDEPYFHFHESLPLKALIDEIAQYDWGLWVHSEQVSRRTQPDKMKTGIGNKMFSYLEAGLPVVVSDSRPYGASVVVDNQLGFAVNDRDWGKLGKLMNLREIEVLKQSVLEGRQRLSIQSRYAELADFYESVLNKM